MNKTITENQAMKMYGQWARLQTVAWGMSEAKTIEHITSRLVLVEREPPDLVAKLYHPGSASPSAVKLDVPRASGTVAVVPIRGVIYQRRNWMGDVFTEELSAMIGGLVRNETIGAIVLDVDSPGGTVSGTPELAEEIRGHRGAKPIYSLSNPEMASAAYWIGSAADKTFVTPSGEVGSVGVWTVHVDMSKMLEEAGLKVTAISAGKYKLEGNPWEPLGDEAREAIQADVDLYYDQFVEAVAKSRNRRATTVRNGFGEGRMVTAQEAVDEGMVDGIATMGELLGALVPKRRGTSVASASLDIELAEDG